MMNEEEMMPESAVPQSEEGPEDFSQGFSIHVSVTPTGFLVSGPLPLSPEPQMEDPNQEQGDEEWPDIASALKHVLAIIKEHPLGNDGEAQMQAGFEAKNL